MSDRPARWLLARAYYHSAQLRRAESELRVIVERDPVEHYARLMLGRALERQGRQEEVFGPGPGQGAGPEPRPARAPLPLYFTPAPLVRPRRCAISPRTTSTTMNAASGMPRSGTK